MLGWHFTKHEHKVSLYEKSERSQPQSAAHVAASMLALQSERPEADESIWNLAEESLRDWPSWLDELEVPYAIDGAIVVAHPNDESLLDKFQRSLQRFGVSDFCGVSQHQLRKLEPELTGRFRRGFFLRREGWLDNRALLDSLETRCGTIHYESDVNPEDLEADLAIDCRGIGSNDPELRGVRGEVMRLYAPEVNLTRPIRLLHPKYRLYVSPRGDHGYVVGATQLESDFSGSVTVRSALELLSAAYTVHEGFEEAEIVELGSGLRPAYPDNAPRIFWRNGVLSVNGLYRHGFLIAPALVNRVANEVDHKCKS